MQNNPTPVAASWLRRLGLGLLFVVSTCTVSFALIEVGARVWLTRAAPQSSFERYASLDQLRVRAEKAGESLSKFERHLHIGFVGSPSFRRGANRHNTLGLRGEEIPQPKPVGEYRIVCLGGSTTYTSFVQDYRLSYPALLQNELRGAGYGNVRVINAGLPGWTSYESLINFELRVLDLEPDMIIVYHAVNDLIMRLVWPPEEYRGDNSGAKGPAPGLDRPIPVLERSTALRMAMIGMGLAESATVLDTTFIQTAPSFFGHRYMTEQDRGIYPSQFFVQTPPRKILARNPPTYFRRNIEHMMLIARHRNIQPVLATFAYFERDVGGDALSTPLMRSAMDEMNEVIREIGREYDVPVFDFATLFPQDPNLFVGSVHVNRAGAQLKAELFAKYLIDSKRIR